MTGPWMLMLALSAPALAQEGEADAPAAEEQAPPSSENGDLAAKPEILQLLELPSAADRYRQSGASEADTGQALRSMQEAGVPAAEAAQTMEQANQAAREHGPTDNFGAFVQGQLKEGKRGNDLADAIHEEHRAHGKGKMHEGKPDGDVSNDKGPPDGKGAPEGKGKPEPKDSPDGVAPEGRPSDPSSGRKGGKPPEAPPSERKGGKAGTDAPAGGAAGGSDRRGGNK
ncbi:MAG: hypothetical protein VX899_22830 [Myxococcota bacterium]|nr:hypothetical protein [Myxococcota bacterium]